MKKNTIVFWGQYPGNFETKFFPLRFEGILYNSVGSQCIQAAVGSFSILFLTTRGAVAPKEVIVISSITNDGLSSK